MDLLSWHSLLAQVPSGEMYVHPGKLVGLALLYTCWILYAAWADKDAVAVNTFRQVWNMSTIAVGAVGLLVLLFVPSFLFGALAFIVINGAYMLVYVNHRNHLVVEENRVLTAQHFQRIMSEGFGGKKKGEKLQEVKELVKIAGPEKKYIAAPTEPIERAQYALAQQIMFDMLHRRATVMEMVTTGEQSRIRLHIDGVPADREPIAAVDGQGFLLFMKKLARLNPEERRKPQKGMMHAQIGETKFEIMVKTTGSNAGEQLSLRVLGPERFAKIADLGMSDAQLDSFRKVMFGDKGLVLVTALPGNGLSTTMYSLARSHDAFLQNIQFIEWDHEFDIENITQKTYTPSPDHSFAAELLKVVRADPNVVLLPELRNDKAGTVAAIEAAIRKQIVYIAMPAIDVFDGIARLVKLAGDQTLVSKGLVAVLHQRLTRKLCESCKAPYKPDPALLQKINLPADRVLHKPPEPQFDKRGNPIICPNCQGTGYSGRTAIFQLLVIDDELRNVIKSGGSINDLKTAAAKKGLASLQSIGLQKAVEGVTSIDEIGRATKNPAAPKPPPAAGAQPTAA